VAGRKCRQLTKFASPPAMAESQHGLRVVITGAGGFFGLALTRAFAGAGHTVLATDAAPLADFLPRPATPLERVHYLTADVTDRDSLHDLLGSDIDAVVHAAALTPTDRQQHETPERIVDVNLGGTVNLLSFARQTPRCRRFVYVSSTAVFDQSKAAILREEDAMGGNSLYGAAKLAGEYLVQRYGQMFDLVTAVVRPASLYGPGEQPRPSRPNTSAVYQLVEAALRVERVRIKGRDARCDWLYVDDAADAVCRLITSDAMAGQVLNLSSGRACPFGEVVDAIAATLPLRIDDRADQVIDGSPDRPATIANHCIRAALGWEPCDMVIGIHRYVSSLVGSEKGVDTAERPGIVAFGM
jgi:nucleoside-diphosphate-sugar epimerase